MFELIVVVLILWTVLTAAGYGLGHAWPRTAIALAGIVGALMGCLWWLVWREGVEDGASFMGLAILMVMSTHPLLFVIGLVAGARRQPPIAIGAWVGLLAAAILVGWPSAGFLQSIAPLVFVAGCVVGALWERLTGPEPPARRPIPSPDEPVAHL